MTVALGRPVHVPSARGPLSAAVLVLLHGDRLARLPDPAEADPYGDDLQLALYLCYELSYRGLPGVSDDMEWSLELLPLRVAMEDRFLAAVRTDVPGGDDLDAEVAALLTEPVDGTGVSHHLESGGTLAQLREYVATRSIYHLKEADPQAWVIPRLDGPAKAAIVSVEHDEYGAGRSDRMHSNLFATMMRELWLDDTYGAYVDKVPASVLAEVNFMTLTGLRRALRAAALGQFAVIELTSSPGSARLVRAARRLGDLPATERFYAEHVEADAVHEQLLRHGVLAELVAEDPSHRSGLVLGMQASTLLSARSAQQMLEAWREGRQVLTLPTLQDADCEPSCRDGG